MNPTQLIKRRRTELNLTQAELAKAANLSQSMISKIESGKLVPSLIDADRIFKVLKMEVTIGVKK